MSFKFEVMIQSLKVASQYIGTTLFMAITAIVIGVILGLVIALIRLYRIKGLSQFFQVVVTLLKGIPMVLIILALYLIAYKQFDVWSESMN